MDGPSIERTLDEDTGIITVTARGVWTRSAVDEHFSALRRMIFDLRQANRQIRVLSDVTQAVRQDPALEEHIRWQMDQTYRPGDRIALLAADADDKAYARIAIGRRDIAAFSSRLPAEMWLLLDEMDIGAP